MPFDPKKFVTAHFVDDNRETVEILLIPHGKEEMEVSQADYESYVLSYREEDRNGDRDALDELIDLDTLHENTYINKKGERQSFEAMVKMIGEEEGMLTGKNLQFSDAKLWGGVWDWFFKEFDEETMKEELFTAKLSIFEQEFVKENASSKQKSDIRKAKTPLDLLNFVSQIGKK